MVEVFSIEEVAKYFGISIDNVTSLIKQGILHPQTQKNGSYFFLPDEITEIKSRSGPTVSEEAALISNQIEREVVTTVSKLQIAFRRVSLASLGILVGFSLSTILIACLFYLNPQATSDFFGYYYRFNAPSKSQVSAVPLERSQILGAATDSEKAAVKTTLLADVLKPIAATSLLVVKATDSQKYEQIVTNPSLSTILPGPAGSQGPAGLSGQPGQSGQAGLAGAQGIAGPAGDKGKDGADGSSPMDVMSTAGDLVIRDKNNSTTRLAVGSDGQLLTVSNQIPTWSDLKISNLTNANLSGNAGIVNANLAHPALTVTAGKGLTGGGLVALGDTATLNLNLTASGTAGLSSSNSGMEVSTSGLTLLHGCSDGQLLKWADSGGWRCADDLTGTDLQQAVSYDGDDRFTNITSSETILTTVTVSHLTKTADIYVTGQAEVFSGSNDDQPFLLAIETGEKCDGPAVGNARVVYTITSRQSTTALRGVLIISGIDLNPDHDSRSYSLCASTAAGNTDVQNWRLEALVID